MGLVIRFQPSKPRKASLLRAPREGEAEIMFFTGIRYERWQDETPAGETAKPRRRGSRRLKSRA